MVKIEMKYLFIVILMSLLNIKTTVKNDNKISGNFIGQNIDSTTDHELATYYFNKCTDSTVYDPQLDKLLMQVFSTLDGDKPTPMNLKKLSNTVSVDFATLYFAQKSYFKPKNFQAQNVFQDFLDNQKIGEDGKIQIRAEEYLYLFVPGLFYKRNPETGGDFASQRKLLNNMGLSTHLIEINEVGSIEENAILISAEIKRLSKAYTKIIIVSASKGGPDVAYALGNILSHDDSKLVKAWISIGGVLRGSEIADQYSSGLKRIWTKLILFFIGANIGFVEELSQEKSIARHDSLNFPKDLLIFHYIGAPLSSQVSKKVKSNFEILSEEGPNDGLTLLTDELTEQGFVITEIGLDHYYADPEIDKKAVALLHTALNILDPKNTIKNNKENLVER